MAIFQKFFIFSLLFSLLNCTCEELALHDDNENLESYVDDTANKDSCAIRKFDDSEKRAGAYKCCYVNSRCPSEDGITGNKIYRGCVVLTKVIYNNIDNYIRATTQCDSSLDCGDAYVDETSENRGTSGINSLSYLVFILLFLI